MSGLKINKKFAEKYEKYRQKEELQRRKLYLKHKHELFTLSNINNLRFIICIFMCWICWMLLISILNVKCAKIYFCCREAYVYDD